MPLKYTWEIERGDYQTLVVTYQEQNGTPVDLTLYTATLVKHDDFTTIPCSITIPSPTNGKIHLAMSSLQTSVLIDKDYRLRITSGASVTTILEGLLHVS